MNNFEGRLIFSGELTLKHVREAQAFLLQQSGDEAGVMLQDVKAIDLSFIQLLWSYTRALKAKGKTVTVEARLTPDITQLINATGFQQFIINQNGYE